MIDAATTQRGFLPAEDPACRFPDGSDLTMLDELGRDLPSLLYKDDFRSLAERLEIPRWSEPVTQATLPLLRLYYLRLGFLASAYVNQVTQPQAELLPANIAKPLCHVCELLNRPPILSYDGYALYNWKRFDSSGPIALGNIDTLQNFVHLYDEHWFVLVHVEIEAIAAKILAAIADVERAFAVGTTPANAMNPEAILDAALNRIAEAVWSQVGVLRRIPEHMDPALYFKTFRPYIRFFENVVYEEVSQTPLNFRGETGAQSSIMPLLVGFMKIKHRQSALTDHLEEMRRFMPSDHRVLIQHVETLPSIRSMAKPDTYNEVLEAMATFREVHFGWAQEYIDSRTDDPRGTGGTPYMAWLKQLIDETRSHMLSPVGDRRRQQTTPRTEVAS